MRKMRCARAKNAFVRLADNIPNLAWMAQAHGHISWYNRRWYEYTGTTFEDMEGWGWQRVHHPDMLGRVIDNWRQALEQGTSFEMEFPLRASDGSFQWFLTQVRAVRNEAGEIVRWFGTNTNIDDKRRAEEALLQSEELARSVIAGSPVGVEVLEPSGRTLLINDESRRLRGSNETSDQASWMDIWCAEDRERATENFAIVVRGQAVQFEASCAVHPKHPIRVDVSLTPLLDSEGNVSRVLCMTRDVTRERRAEEEVRQTAKLESLGVMAGGIAHDFNNLLTGILGNASLLAESVSEEDQQLAEDITLAAERAADLTRQMLAFAGKGRFEIKRLDISDMVREILRLTRRSIEKNVDVQLELEAGCFVEGDPSQIQQVIMNLLINAAEAMEGRPGLIRVSTCKVNADAAYLDKIDATEQRKPGEYVLIEVEDNGSGMDEAVKARIFDPFFTTKFTGRGLGLAAVSGIVRGHHGLMTVHSVVGQGTTFKILFPLSEAVENSETRRTPAPGQGVVLLIDDEDIVRRAGVAALNRHGYDVLVAHDGGHALDIFAERHRDVDVVVLDMMMPVMSGAETLKGMREIDAGVPVIVCSGYNEVEVIRRFTDQRIGSFLQKPYSAARLVEAVQGVLSEFDSGA